MLIFVDHSDPRPIYRQIVAQIKEQIRTGRLAAGDELPSVRELGESLGVNLHTVRHAYQQLREQGFLRLRLGQRARVLAAAQRRPSRERLKQTLIPPLKELISDALHQGLSGATSAGWWTSC